MPTTTVDVDQPVVATVEDIDHHLQSLLTKYEDLFREELGIVTTFTAKLHVRTEATHKFYKARPVPFAIKEAVSQSWTALRHVAFSGQ